MARDMDERAAVTSGSGPDPVEGAEGADLREAAGKDAATEATATTDPVGDEPAAPEAGEGELPGGDSPIDTPSDGPAGRRSRKGAGIIVGIAAAALVVAALGAPRCAAETPRASGEAKAPEAVSEEGTDLDSGAVETMMDGMGVPESSSVRVVVEGKHVIVYEEAQLVDKLVAERTYDRAYELAGEVKESQAETVTWVLDNGKGATAAVTIKVDDDRDESKAPTDVAGKLASAEGYSLNEGAYDPVKSTVKEPAAGEMPVSTEGDELVKPAKKAEETPASESSSRTPSTDAAASTSSGRNTSSSSSSSGTSMTRDSGSSSSSSSSRPSSSGSSSGSSSSSSSSSEPAKHWVEEKGHWEDTYESQEVKTGTRWVVDQAAWDEDVYETITVWYTSDGMRFTDPNELDSYMYEQLLNDNYLSSGVVSEEVWTGTVHHDEVGHYEDVYETQQVKTGSTWVVDVPGHWE